MSILVPIGLCFWAYKKKAEGTLQLFLLFLIFGFVVDGLGWYQHEMKPTEATRNLIRYLHSLYLLADALFFFWYIAYSSSGMIQRIGRIAIYVVVPCWLLLEIMLPYQWFGTLSFFDTGLVFYQALYRVTVAFLAGWALLLLLENDVPLSTSWSFWLLTGIFFYNFSTFFIMLLREVELGGQLWFLHNIMNLLTYLFYSAGFLAHIWQHRPS